MNQINAADILASGAATYAERNATYGGSYKEFGAIMAALFPGGITMCNAQEWNEMAILVTIVSKLSRFANSLKREPYKGHIDSIHDIMVYAAMLEELLRADQQTSLTRADGAPGIARHWGAVGLGGGVRQLRDRAVCTARR